MIWDYAELSKKAKEYGGPEKLIEIIFNDGRSTGHREMKTIVVGGVIVGIAVGVGMKMAIDYIYKKVVISKSDVEKSKAQIINGINEYDIAEKRENRERISALESTDEIEEFPQDILNAVVWEGIKECIKEEMKLTDISYKTWIEPLKIKRIEEKRIIIDAARVVGIEYMIKRFDRRFRTKLLEKTGIYYETEYVQ